MIQHHSIRKRADSITAEVNHQTANIWTIKKDEKSSTFLQNWEFERHVGKYIAQIHSIWQYNHNKTKCSKTKGIFSWDVL